ncbi:hypothetical protein J2R98_001659 [Alkalibacillus filiformis]|uniref:DUF4358 domain-containing protein n=1 Tax=Alkalibacillus filiformis TaxID=200990 RepID=A0ABU0DTN2_9BACI|nr:hypothetical protein [Alkalibacillus filiformis]
MGCFSIFKFILLILLLLIGSGCAPESKEETDFFNYFLERNRPVVSTQYNVFIYIEDFEEYIENKFSNTIISEEEYLNKVENKLESNKINSIGILSEEYISKFDGSPKGLKTPTFIVVGGVNDTILFSSDIREIKKIVSENN